MCMWWIFRNSDICNKIKVSSTWFWLHTGFKYKLNLVGSETSVLYRTIHQLELK
jgi:hypothetical protein